MIKRLGLKQWIKHKSKEDFNLISLWIIILSKIRKECQSIVICFNNKQLDKETKILVCNKVTNNKINIICIKTS